MKVDWQHVHTHAHPEGEGEGAKEVVHSHSHVHHVDERVVTNKTKALKQRHPNSNHADHSH